MIFATDLDQTMIFSERHITDDLKDKVIPSEMKNGSIVTFMLHETLDKIKSLSHKLVLIPTTTRTLEQYERISVFKSCISPKFAVVNHGGSVLIDGVLDKNWDKCIRNKLSVGCEPLVNILDKFKNQLYYEDWILDVRQVEEFFFYCIVNLDTTPMTELIDFMKEIESYNWYGCLHGRKLYFLPKSLNKWNAIEYIKDMLPNKQVVSSGDSYMDFELLSMADYAILPSHGEICNKFNPDKKRIITNSKGLEASLEILHIVEKIYNSAYK